MRGVSHARQESPGFSRGEEVNVAIGRTREWLLLDAALRQAGLSGGLNDCRFWVFCFALHAWVESGVFQQDLRKDIRDEETSRHP